MKNVITYILEAYNNAGGGDEFYTHEQDIAKEIEHYNLKGKVVYCNCDDPSFSKFYKYFKDNFAKLGIKKLLSTFYSDEPKLTEYDGHNEKITNIKSGDFRDNGKIMDNCDIVITNPPYSNNFPEQLVKMCIEHHKDFLFIGPNHFITKRYALELYKEGKLNVGYNTIYKFYRPNGEGNMKVPTCWYTSLDVVHKDIPLTKSYNEKDYPKYDNYDAIHCPNIKDIPKDYKGNIATSIQIAHKLSRDQFEIVDAKSPKLDGKKTFMKLIIHRKG